jgi:hypothetical protein
LVGLRLEDHAEAWRAYLKAHGPQSAMQLARAMKLSDTRTHQIIQALTMPTRRAEWADFRAGHFRIRSTRGIPRRCLYLAHQADAVRALGWTPAPQDNPKPPPATPAPSTGSAAPSTGTPWPPPIQPRPRTLNAQEVLLDTMCVLEEHGPLTLREVSDLLKITPHDAHTLLSSLSYGEVERRMIPDSKFHLLYLPDQRDRALERAESMRGYAPPAPTKRA